MLSILMVRFLPPGIFFEQHDTTTHGNGINGSSNIAYLNRLRINNRYGIKADLGYDVTDRIAPYFTSGYSRISYNAQNTITRSGITYSDQKNSSLGDWFYGAGLKLKYNNDISINIEYNYQKFSAKTAVRDTKNYNGVYNTSLSVAKIGVFYNF